MTTYTLADLGNHPSAMGRRCEFTTPTGVIWRGTLAAHWETHLTAPGKHVINLRIRGSMHHIGDLSGDTVITIYPKESA